MKQTSLIAHFLTIPLLLAGLLLAPAVSQAANTYYYTSTAGGSAPPTDGAGSWNTTVANWLLNDTGTAGDWVNNNNAVIGNGGTAGSIACGSAIVVGNVTFNAVASGYYTFNSGNIRVGGAGANGNVSTFLLPSGVSADFGNGGGSGQYLAEGTSGSGITADGGGTLMLTYTHASTYTGPSTIQGATTVYIGSGFVSSSSSALNLTSGTLGAFNSTALSWTKPVNLKGNFTLGAPSPRNGNLTFGTGAWTLSGGSWTITNNTISATINSAIGQDVSGRGLASSSLNGGALTLGATETYTGPTTINSGTLALASGGNLNAASGVVIAAGGTFDVSAKTIWTAGSTASPAITASGTATAATIKGGTTVAFGSQPITLNYDGTDDTMLTISAGALTMNGNVITINGSSTLTHGPHNIIAVTGGSITLSSTPTVIGTAIASGDQATVSTSGGTPNYLVINVQALATPTLDTLTKSAITNTSATLGATVESASGSTITDYGIVWGTSLNPTTSGNKVQFGTSVTPPSTFIVSATGLPTATTIYYRGYATSANGTGYSTNDTFLTLTTPPTIQASNVQFKNVQGGAMTVNWTRGNGTSCIVLVSAGSAVSSDPVAGQTYTANANFGSGSPMGTGYVVYSGTGTNVSLLALAPGTTYYVAVYEFNGSGGTQNYLTPAATCNQAASTGHPVVYYSGAASATATNPTAWWTGNNGTGANPADFNSGDTFIIQNGHNYYLETNMVWSVNAVNAGIAATLQINSGGHLTNDLAPGSPSLKLGGNLNQAAAGGIISGQTSSSLNIEFTGNGAWTGSGDISAIKASVTVDPSVTLDASGLSSGFVLKSGNTIGINVNGSLNIGTNTISGNGNGSASFTLGSAGTLITARTAGVPAIFTNFFTGKVTLPNTANYTFDGTAAQVTGTSTTNATMPNDVNILTISNSAGVTLSQATEVDGTLVLTAGVATGNVTLGSISATITGGGSSAYVNGQLTVPFNAPGGVSFTFPVGTASAYSPISVANFTDSGSDTLTASATAAQDPNQASSSIDGTKYIARYWTLTENGGFVSPTYDFTGTFVSGDIQGGATTTNLIVQKWDGGSWASPSTGSTSTSTMVTGTGFTTDFGQFAAGDIASLPVVVATTRSGVTNTAATLGATVTSDNGSAITNYGIVWGTSLNPTTSSNKIQAGTSPGTLPNTFTVSATGLPLATPIYYRGYAISASGTGYSTNDTFLTLTNVPTIQASGVGGYSFQNGNLSINWNRGNGARCIVLVNAGSPVDSNPVAGTTYTANANFGSGSLIGPDNYVAYLGTGTNVTLTGLSLSTTYYVAVYELNGSGGSENYLTPPATDSQTTVDQVVTVVNWTGGQDTDWNNTNNWDLLVVPGVGTSATIPSAPANQPVYSNPMAAASFGGMTSAGTLTVATNGFNCGAVLLNRPDGVAKIFVNNGGVASISGNLGICSNAVASMALGSSLAISGQLNIGSDIFGGNNSTATVGCIGVMTNLGGTLTAASVSLNPRNASIGSPCRLVINGGTNSLGAVSISRSDAGSGGYDTLGSEGMLIYGGQVNMTSLNVGASGGNSFLTTLIAGGIVTNTGNVTINQGSSARGSRLLQTGGLFVVGGLANPNPTVSGSLNVYSVTGGTNIVGGVALGTGTSPGNVYFTNGAVMYVGSQGIGWNSNVTLSATLSGGSLLGATADWTGSAPMQMDPGIETIQAADLNGTAHNITISGLLSGFGGLTKTGNGTLTLNAADTYSGNTLIYAGDLVVGVGGYLNNSGKFYVGSGATFDVSAVTGGFTIVNQTLTGLGVITGAVTIASSATHAIDPGSNTLTGTLSFSNSVTETGGAINHFDLAGAPNPNNDFVIIAGNFNVSGTNAMDIGGSSLQVGSVYPLVKYGGSFNGGVTNFIVTSAVGILTNDPTAQTISFIPAATLRGPTNIVWIGNPVNTNWDTEVSANWLNAGTLDFFVPKDSVQFTDAGASNSPVNIVGTVTPTSVLVNSHSNYVFASTSGGSIGDPSTGPGNLTVTNTGTLTILTTNTYTGITTIDGGSALAVSQVANVNSPSAVGESDTLVINNGTFIYSGSNASINRGATLGNAASVINVSANGTLTLNGVLGGAGGLTKAGPGNLILPNGNSFGSGTFVNAGTLTLNSASAAGGGTITLNGGTLALGAVKPANTINVAASSIITGGNSGGATGIKNVTGSSNVLVTVTGSGSVFDLTGNMSAYSGTITFSNAGGAFVRLNGTTGSALATWNLGAGLMDLNERAGSTSNNIGALAGASGTTLSGRGGSGNNGATTYYIGANGLSTSFGGIIQNGSGTGSTTAINKMGSGTLALSGSSTYTGSTTVSSGTLEVDGSLASSSVVTVNGGTLAGIGTIGGATTLNAGAILSAGSNSVGSLTFSGNLTLNAASTNSFAVTTASGVSNSVTVSGTLYPNSSVIQITSGTSLAVGTYTLFNYAGISGSFNATPVFDVAPTATASIVDTGSQIQLVLASGPTGPGTITNSISGSTLTLTWPAGQGWRLVSQTNSLSTGLNANSSAWSNVPGVSDGSATITIDPTQPTIFYRLIYP